MFETSATLHHYLQVFAELSLDVHISDWSPASKEVATLSADFTAQLAQLLKVDPARIQVQLMMVLGYFV